MSKYVRVMDGLKSNANGIEFKLDEVMVADLWNPNEKGAEKMGGFNFSVEGIILRWINRGDTIYDVIIPEDAEMITVSEEKGLYRANKIIVTNPRKITDEMLLDLYKKNTMTDKTFGYSLRPLLLKNRLEIVKYIIKDRVNKDNVDEILEAFIKSTKEDINLLKDIQTIINILKNIQGD